jgi:hypothetical protein
LWTHPFIGGLILCETWFCTTTGSFYVHLNISGTVIFERKIPKRPHTVFVILNLLKKTWPFYLNKLEFSSPKNDLCRAWWKLTRWFWKRRFLKDYFQYKHMNRWFSYCGPIWPLGTMIWTNMNMNYVRKFSCRYEIFWPSNSWDFQMTPPLAIFAFLWLSSLWRGSGPLFEQF